jgi:hypothetical protein
MNPASRQQGQCRGEPTPIGSVPQHRLSSAAAAAFRKNELPQYSQYYRYYCETGIAR